MRVIVEKKILAIPDYRKTYFEAAYSTEITYNVVRK